MMLPKVNGCCCCFSLRTGTLILGWITVISAVFNALGVIKELSSLDDLREKLEATNQLPDDCGDDCISSIKNWAFGVGGVMIFMNVTIGVVASLLLYGVHKNRPGFITPCLVYMLISFICSAVVIIAGIVILAPVPVIAVVYTLLMLACVGLNCYYFVVITSYQTEVREALGKNQIMMEEAVDQGYAVPTNQAYAVPTNQAYAVPTNQAYAVPTNQGYAFPPNQGYAVPPNKGYAAQMSDPPPPYQEDEAAMLKSKKPC